MTNYDYADLKEQNVKNWKEWNDWDDSKSREFVIRMFLETFGIKLKNGKKRGIDLLRENLMDGGVEIEHGGWDGDVWVHLYSLLSKLTINGKDVRTVNIPDRKDKYWFEWVFRGKSESLIKKKCLDKNVFVRTNSDFSQVIIIRPEIIRDNKKMFICKIWTSNTRRLENFFCFKREDVETYNLIDGKYILQ